MPAASPRRRASILCGAIKHVVVGALYDRSLVAWARRPGSLHRRPPAGCRRLPRARPLRPGVSLLRPRAPRCAHARLHQARHPPCGRPQRHRGGGLRRLPRRDPLRPGVARRAQARRPCAGEQHPRHRGPPAAGHRRQRHLALCPGARYPQHRLSGGVVPAGRGPEHPGGQGGHRPVHGTQAPRAQLGCGRCRRRARGSRRPEAC